MVPIKHLTKCSHCDYIDFLYKIDVPSRCPSCGAVVKQIENPFETESIKVKHDTTGGRKVKLQVTFYQCADRIRNIVGNSLNKSIPDEFLKERILYMLQFYAWVLLKKAPQLWLDLDFLVGSIKEILALRLK